MYDVLRGSPWEILRAFLSPDVLMRLRTTERYWNKGDKYGPYGDFFLFGEGNCACIDYVWGSRYMYESNAKR